MRRHFKTLRGPNASQLHRPDPPPEPRFRLLSPNREALGFASRAFYGVLRGLVDRPRFSGGSG